MSGTEGIPAAYGEEDVKCMTTDLRATCAGLVFDRTGTVVASIRVSGPDSRIDEASIPAMAEVVRRAA